MGRRNTILDGRVYKRPAAVGCTVEEEASGPVFTRPLYNTRVAEGQRARLECHVTGSPEPRVAWTLDGVELNSSAEFATTRRGSVCCLEIVEVVPEDDGEYAVTASNVHGSMTTAARLTVDSKHITIIIITLRLARRLSTNLGPVPVSEHQWPTCQCPCRFDVATSVVDAPEVASMSSLVV